MEKDNGAKDYNPRTAERQSIQAQASASPIEMLPMGAGGMDGGLLWINLGRYSEEIPAWSIYPGIRDWYLRNIAKYEPAMASAIYSMKTRMVTLGYELNGPPRAKKLASELLNTCDFGKGMTSLLAKVTDDLMSTDNGAFIERQGPGNPLKPLAFNLVTGFNHLDSRQCYRTFDPEFPVIYFNPETRAFHKMHHTRIVMVSDNPQPIERARGIGFCAVSRALQWVRIMRDTLTYREEKIAGRFTRAIGVAKGININQLKDALEEQKTSDEAAGYIIYRNIPILAAPAYQGKSEAEILLTDLASIPDGFVFESDLTLYIYLLAFAFGVDAREFWPATASGATKADASVQNQKARGRGIGALIRINETLLRACIPETVELAFDFTDDEQDSMREDIQGKRINNLARLQQVGALSSLEIRALSIADGIVDPAILATVQTLPVTEDTPQGEPASQEGNVEPSTEDTPKGDEKTLDADPFGLKDYRTPANAYYERATNDFQRDLEAATEDAIARLPDEPSAQDISVVSEGLAADLLALLEMGITQAYGVGLGGASPSIFGAASLQSTADTQRRYLLNFAASFSAAISAGVIAGYIGSDLRSSLSGFVSRAGLYAGSFWESIWRGLKDALTQENKPLKVRRVLDDRAAHCKTCPPKAGEYDSFEQMEREAGIPGDLTDDCLANCRCFCEVETSSGSGIFKRFNGPPTVFTSPLIRIR